MVSRVSHPESSVSGKLLTIQSINFHLMAEVEVIPVLPESTDKANLYFSFEMTKAFKLCTNEVEVRNLTVTEYYI